MASNEIEVSSAMAKLFKDQCDGDSNGHMALIPNSPVIQSILKASEVKSDSDFSWFLRGVADWIDGGGHA